MNDTQELNNIEQQPDRLEQNMPEETFAVREELVIEEDVTLEEEDEADECVAIEAGEFSAPKEEKEEEEVQQMHTKHPRPEIPTIDHRLLAGKLGV